MSTDFSCCDFGTCNRGIGCPAGSVVAQDLLGTDPLPGLMTYDDAQKQWITRPLYNHLHTENSDGSDPEVDEPWLTGQRVLIGAGVFLAVCVAGFSTLLYFYR